MEELTREYFDDPDNKLKEKDLKVGDHFMLDLYPVYDNGECRDPTDVEIWEVVVTSKKIYHKRRSNYFYFDAVKMITTGRQFNNPNGCWKVPGVENNGI